MNKLKMRLAAYMNGRYGYDQLGKLLIGASIVCLILSFFTFNDIFYYLGIILLVFCYYRMFSKNISKRDSENRKFTGLTGKVTARFRGSKRRISERKTHNFFKCRNCSQTIRVPKGKGNIYITCPKCKTEFQAKT